MPRATPLAGGSIALRAWAQGWASIRLQAHTPLSKNPATSRDHGLAQQQMNTSETKDAIRHMIGTMMNRAQVANTADKS